MVRTLFLVMSFAFSAITTAAFAQVKNFTPVTREEPC